MISARVDRPMQIIRLLRDGTRARTPDPRCRASANRLRIAAIDLSALDRPDARQPEIPKEKPFQVFDLEGLLRG